MLLAMDDRRRFLLESADFKRVALLTQLSKILLLGANETMVERIGVAQEEDMMEVGKGLMESR